jgi:hypothetical protein
MATNPLLEEFAVTYPGALQRQLTDKFDNSLQQLDEEIVTIVKTELDAILKGRIDEIGED